MQLVATEWDSIVVESKTGLLHSLNKYLLRVNLLLAKLLGLKQWTRQAGSLLSWRQKKLNKYVSMVIQMVIRDVGKPQSTVNCSIVTGVHGLAQVVRGGSLTTFQGR